MNERTDPQTVDALRRDRETPAPEQARARVASRLGITGPFSGPLPPQGGVGAAKTWGAHTASLVALTFLAGGAAGMLLHARLTGGNATRVVYISGPAPSVSTPVATSAPSPTRAAVPPAADSSALASSVSTAVVASPSQARFTQLDAERSLLDSARVALVDGDSDTALRALDRHAKTYRRPLLGEEHDALVVQTLVRAGRYDEARSRAEEFRRKAPQSLLLPAVDAAIASIP
jgi:hypothetical protein